MISKPTQQSGLVQFTLSAFASAAIASFAFSQKAPLAFAFLLPCGLARFWKIQRLPEFVVRWTRYAAWVVLGGTVLLGLIHRAYPILSEEAVKRPLTLAGFGLAFFAALFLLGSRVWPPARTLFPVTIGMFLVAAINPQPPQLHLMLAVAGAAAYLYLVAQGRPLLTRGSSTFAMREQWVRLGISGGMVFLIAWGIIQILPWLQVRVVQATNRMAFPQIDFYAGLSQDSRLGDLEELQLSQKIVMRVWTSRPQKLRGRVFTLFDGQAWHATGKGGRSLMPAPSQLPAGATARVGTVEAASLEGWLKSLPGNTFILPRNDAQISRAEQGVRTKIVQTVFNGGQLVMPGNKLIVRLAAPYLREDLFEDISQNAITPVEIYGVVNLSKDNLAQEGPSPDESLESCLLLPANTDSRLKEIAERMKVGANSPAERIQKTLNYIQSQCHYSLKVGKFHTAQPVTEFLFEKKRGYCEYFASAAAVLLRLEGVPSRYVTGFNLQDGNREGSHYVVREADAHAWIEAYIPSEGWVEIDPTPESEYEALHSNPHDGWLAASIEWLATIYAETAARLGQGEWLLTVQWIWSELKVLAISAISGWRNQGLLLLAVLLSVTIFFARRRRTSPALPMRDLSPRDFTSVPPELHELMGRLDRLCARAGFSRPGSRAPLEHWIGIPGDKISPALRDSSRHIIEYYYRTSFGGNPYSTTEARDLNLKLDEAEET